MIEQAMRQLGSLKDIRGKPITESGMDTRTQCRLIVKYMQMRSDPTYNRHYQTMKLQNPPKRKPEAGDQDDL
jgi:hypothetical protein